MKNNIEIDPREVQLLLCERVNWMRVPHDTDKWWAPVSVKTKCLDQLSNYLLLKQDTSLWEVSQNRQLQKNS
jgi:hypothetical protein